MTSARCSSRARHAGTVLTERRRVTITNACLGVALASNTRHVAQLVGTVGPNKPRGTFASSVIALAVTAAVTLRLWGRRHWHFRAILTLVRGLTFALALDTLAVYAGFGAFFNAAILAFKTIGANAFSLLANSRSTIFACELRAILSCPKTFALARSGSLVTTAVSRAPILAQLELTQVSIEAIITNTQIWFNASTPVRTGILAYCS